jgi:hypothetical protein
MDMLSKLEKVGKAKALSHRTGRTKKFIDDAIALNE